MNSSFYFTTCAAAIALFTLLRKLKSHKDNKEDKSASPSSSLSPLSPPPPCRTWTHHVFPSFRGDDVRRDFLSHIQMEFQRTGITPFIDNEIKKGESIGPELIRAIRGSKIAVVLLSRNYASSSWCLDELVEIIKCREEIGQTVMAIFYKVDPTDVKKQTGYFGKVFRKTCAGKSKEHIGRWRHALAQVATIAGYHSNGWDNEAAMIKKIASDISNILNNSTPSSDFDGLVGMESHLGKLMPMLRLDSDEVRMLAIWGPPGIGKTTIARVVYNQLFNGFQLSAFVENIKTNYARGLCSDDYPVKLQLQQQLVSQITNRKDMKIPHLGVVQDRLKDKKVLVVLDGVNHVLQLEAMAKEEQWFGPGSRIIITTQDRKLCIAHGINDIYKVEYPPDDEALQIFCMYAFGEKKPKDGFEELAWDATRRAGNLPLCLKLTGSYFRGMSKQKWQEVLPSLPSLNADVQSILKFSYDALDDVNKELFLHIAFFFNHFDVEILEELLGKKFSGRLNVLAEKSLISLNMGLIVTMHSLLEQLGLEIIRKQSIHEPGQCQFLVDEEEICEVLNGEAVGSRSVIGIRFGYSDELGRDVDISERAFEGMSNLQLLIVYGNPITRPLRLPRGLNCISNKLRLLQWTGFPLTCLPSNVNLVFLVELTMTNSDYLEKLWDGHKSLPNLKRIDLSCCFNLKELPDLSSATKLEKLDLSYCRSLVKLPSSIGNATNLEGLYLEGCSELEELPPSIGNLQKLRELRLSGCSKLEALPTNINLESLVELDLSDCTSLVKLSFFIGNATNLEHLNLSYCRSLVKLHSSIGNATNLEGLYLEGCSELEELPPSIGNLQKLRELRLSGCSKLEALPTNINLESLATLDLSDCRSLVKLPSSIGNATNLKYLTLTHCSNLEELPPSIGNLQKLQQLTLRGCSKLEALPTNINLESLVKLDLSHCTSLKSVPQISTNLKILDLEGTTFHRKKRSRE